MHVLAPEARIIRKVDEVSPGQRLRTRLSAGEIESEVLGPHPRKADA